VKTSEEFEAELVMNDKLDELMIDGELEELDGGLKPYDSELPDASAFYRVIRAGGECDPPGTTDDVCEPGTGTTCLPVPGEGINRCIQPANRIPAGGACAAGDVCVERFNCIGGECVIKYGGSCSVGDICEIGYTCVGGRCGVQPARRTIIPAGGACAAGDVCVDRYDCIGGMCVIEYGGSCSVEDSCQRGYTCVGGKCGTGSTSMICGGNSDCTSGYICCEGDCVLAPTGTCTVNCECFNNDCGACRTNCNCFGKCYMPNCGANCNYNGGASYCSPGLAVTEKSEVGFIVEG